MARDISGLRRWGSSSTAFTIWILFFPPTSFFIITANSEGKENEFKVTLLVIIGLLFINSQLKIVTKMRNEDKKKEFMLKHGRGGCEGIDRVTPLLCTSNQLKCNLYTFKFQKKKKIEISSNFAMRKFHFT